MADPPPLPRAADIPADENLRQFAGYNMKRAYLLVREDMNRTLEPLELRTATFSALAIITENPDITQTQLSQAMSIDRSGVVVIVDQLEEAELISRGRVPGDRRSYALRATIQGRKKWKEAEQAVRAHEARLFSALTAEEQSLLGDLLRRITDSNREG
ncbi:MarR family winged helix-turn-helix transcriptional regulator [Mangrovicoccus sp. HB161399]|uniref:MarR family winged helix-turn-helix transcriptional regulator n=1 Tax=Mangrovicoccus sp. HB161399 TaxID=2720392 RepID=UPI0015562508|nr:MarR family transcriptional regulator [Mangrovicoccus sp. HB161399]